MMRGEAAAIELERPPRLQRAEGVGEIGFGMRDGRPRLTRLAQAGAAKIRLPRPEQDRIDVVLLNTAGGLTGGDRFDWSVHAGDDTRATITTQACEKVYRAAHGHAEVAVRLALGRGARLEWLPQETILFDRSALERRLEVELDVGAELLAVEAVVLGRRAMGERVRLGLYRDRWRVRREGRLVFADDLRLEGEIEDLALRACTLGGGGAFASVLVVNEDPEALLDQVRAVLDAAPFVKGGASAFDGKLFCRMIAAEPFPLRRALVAVLGVLRDGRAPPRAWLI